MYNRDTEIEDVIITVESDQGKIECSVITTFEAINNTYIALLPKETDEILLFRYKELEPEHIELINIDDEDEFKLVLDVFDNLMEEI